MTNGNRGPFDSHRFDRRSFLAKSVIGGAIVRSSATDSSTSTKLVSEEKVPAFELDEMTIEDLRQGIDSGKFTARSLAEMYLSRIDAIDCDGPGLNAVIEINPDALRIADQCDKERSNGQPCGPLHGIPVLIKDNIDTADRMATTAGSLALVGSVPPEDSFVVKQLRKAGAVIIGKSNLSEWANIRCTYSTSGWSGRGGLTRNPYALDRNPCGSSSGSAVAVSANLCPVAVGTETDGSIISPSSACGIVGIKPTIGLISRTGIIPISHSQDSAGPMARTVRDAAILLNALLGFDPADDITQSSKNHASKDYTQFLEESGLKSKRLGVARNYFNSHIAVDAVMTDALEVLRHHGAELFDTDRISRVNEAQAAKSLVFKYELKHGLAAYLARLGPSAPVKSLKDIIEFNEKHKDAELQYFGQDYFYMSEEKGPLTEYEYVEALAKCRRISRTEGIDGLMDELQLDAIIAPSLGPACVTDLINGDRWRGGSSSPAAIAGYPSITVPAGFVSSLPVGISFFGRAWSEPVLLKIAYAFEQATRYRSPPRFSATLELFS